MNNFKMNSEQGELVITKPNQHIYIEGGPASGKSQAIIKPLIKQAADWGCAGVVYDIGTGNSYGRLLYTALKQAKEKDETIKTNFSCINFKDMSRTVRVNPLSNKYISDIADLKGIIYDVFNNLYNNNNNSHLRKKYGFNYLLGIAWNLFKNYNEFATIPHVISIATSFDINTVLRWCKNDDEVSMIIAPITETFNGLDIIPSFQQPFQLPLHSPTSSDANSFWVMSKDEFNLDITDPNNQYLLCVEDNIKTSKSLAPYMSSIFSILMKNMNKYEKAKSIFCIDDFCCSFKLDGMDTFLSTARPKGCEIIISVTDFIVISRCYGINAAELIRSNCMTKFFGLTQSFNTAKYVLDLANHFDFNISQRGVMDQNIGHFIGTSANPQYPFYSFQFDEFKYIDEPIPAFAFQSDENNMDKLVMENYERIINEVNQLLEPYIIISE